MKKQSKVSKLALFIVIISISINIFCLPTYAKEEKPIVNDSVLKYNGTVAELPKNIYESYYANPKAESLDVYDENLY